MTGGYVFGGGTIIGTEDGGATWRLVLDLPGGASDKAIGVEALYAADSQKLWVLTTRGTLYRSNDGGRRFDVSRPTYSGTGRLRGQPDSLDVCGSLQFVTDELGWAACTSLVKTTDGGTTWSAMSLAPALGSVDEMWMFDANEGIGITSTNLPKGAARTTDGGTTWTAVPNAPAMSHVSCTKGGFCAGLGPYHDFSVFVSRDHGATWQDLNLPWLRPDQDNFSAIQAIDPSSVAVVGRDEGDSYARDVKPYLDAGQPAPPPVAQERGLLMKWDGATWKRTTYDQPRLVTAMYFVDALHGWLIGEATCEHDLFGPDHNYSLYKTTDGGQTLSYVANYFEQIAALTPSPTPFVIPTPPTP
ncbi:MAG: hypothetical protein HYR72_19145 [Deltaproteobacteria bacterium]|nr:hypothetical protein [Deltaproteobacteria bacterium]MBI3386165.1 hypothetical protein [Deltaproteobacteria bacterium]